MSCLLRKNFNPLLASCLVLVCSFLLRIFHLEMRTAVHKHGKAFSKRLGIQQPGFKNQSRRCFPLLWQALEMDQQLERQEEGWSRQLSAQEQKFWQKHLISSGPRAPEQRGPGDRETRCPQPGSWLVLARTPNSPAKSSQRQPQQTCASPLQPVLREDDQH